jgi:hypothetical protein
MAHVLASTCVALLLACWTAGPATDDSTMGATGAELPLAVHAHLDSAAAAYRVGDFLAARTHYLTAVDSAPGLAASWFGLFLAERALGNAAAADSAIRRARRIATSDSTTDAPGS